MAVNKEGNEFDGLAVLRDVMNIITSYADHISLSNMAQVCVSWRDEVMREREKRCSFLLKRLPTYYKIGNLRRALDIKPYVALLIWRCRYELMSLDQEQYPENPTKMACKTMAVHVVDYVTTEDVEFRITHNGSGELEPDHHSDIAGLFLPYVDKKFHVSIACINTCRSFPYMYIGRGTPFADDPRWQPAVDHLAKELGVIDGEYPKSTILLFSAGSHGSIIAQNFFDRFQSTSCQIMAYDSSIVKPAANNNPHDNTWYDLAGLRISGPNIESWIVDIPCSAEIAEIEMKLQELKEKSKLRRQSLGLFFGFACESCRYEDSRGCTHTQPFPSVGHQQFMRMLQRYFPSIPIAGLLRNNHYGCVWGWLDQPNHFTRLHRDTSVMILTYE